MHADQDFFGNPIGLKPDIGAFESELANEGDELLLVSNVYQIVEEDTGNSVNGIPKNTTVEQFLEKVQYTSTATAQVTRQDTPVRTNTNHSQWRYFNPVGCRQEEAIYALPGAGVL